MVNKMHREPAGESATPIDAGGQRFSLVVYDLDADDLLDTLNFVERMREESAELSGAAAA